MKTTHLIEANQALQNGDYTLAKTLYLKSLSENPELQDLISFNLRFTEQKISDMQESEFSKHTVPPTNAQKAPWCQYPFPDKLLRELHLDSAQKNSLRSFGAAFLGPILYFFFESLARYLSDNPKITRINFLAREGYLLGQLYEALAESKRIKPLKANYILCSRTLLFKVSLSNKSLWPETLKHHFSGTFRQLLSNRFQFNTHEIGLIESSLSPDSSLLTTKISLPDDQNIVIDLLESIQDALNSIVSPKSAAYSSYLTSIGLKKKASTIEHVVDIGYSGTIQKLLAAQLPNASLVGHYFITTSSAVNAAPNTFIGHLLSNVNFGDGHSLLDRSLYMETLLTAPHGQVIDVAIKEGQAEFTFGQRTRAQEEFYKLESIMEGALDYVKIAFDNHLVWEIKDIELFYRSYISNANLFPKELRDIFEIDDTISGLGVLNPIHFFKKLSRKS